MSLPTDFIEAARRYLGVRWHHLGRSPLGLDCVGLLLLAAKDVGIEHPIVPPYPRGHRGFDLFEHCAQIGKQIHLDETQDGDILIFADGHYPAHMGIKTTLHDVPHVLHARIDRRKVVEEPILHEVASSLRRAYRPFAFEAVD